ncbi:MAG: phenylalanine--tRNA ligase beta subunit-related protein [Candidatus Hodarchaeota archaeon]
MLINLTHNLKKNYPSSNFGSLIIRDVQNRKRNETLEERKRDLEKKIIKSIGEVDKDSMIIYYNNYFKIWKKIYPIEYQIKTIKNGGNLPQVSVLVDSMFISELKNKILTSGHDLDAIQGDLTFDVSKGGEKYLQLNGRERKLKKNDIVLKDNEGVLASILYGPTKRTSISLKTENTLYLAWCPYSMDEQLILDHLNAIFLNVNCAFESATSKVQLIQ